MDTVIVYNGHDNTLDLVLVSTSAAGVVTYVDADNFTRYTLEVGTTLVDSVDEGFGSGQPFDTVDVTINSVPVTALRLRTGLFNITAGSYKARLVGYNTANPEGLVWQDKLPLKFLD
jgi:hypothetical protein